MARKNNNNDIKKFVVNDASDEEFDATSPETKIPKKGVRKASGKGKGRGKQAVMKVLETAFNDM